MTNIVKHVLATLAFSALVCTVASDVAHAQARTFVSSFGTDANACSIAAPCRTLQRGIDVVASGGDVLIVDSGGFGANVTITKSVSVIAQPGTMARLAVSSGQTGITVDGSGISVSIGNLGISGIDGEGVRFSSGTALSLSGMDINVRGAISNGVVHLAGGGHLTMAGTLIRNSGSICIGVSGSSESPARATIVKSRAENCGGGFLANNYSTVSVEASSASGDPSACSYGFAAVNTQATLTLDGVVASQCFRGIAGISSGTVTVSNSLLTGNTTAGETSFGGIGRSYGNNRIFGNGTDALTGFTPIVEQ